MAATFRAPQGGGAIQNPAYRPAGTFRFLRALDFLSLRLHSAAGASHDEIVKLKPELAACVEEALRDWKERRDNHGYTLAELRQFVQDGIDSGRGRFHSIDEIKAEARGRLVQRKA